MFKIVNSSHQHSCAGQPCTVWNGTVLDPLQVGSVHVACAGHMVSYSVSFQVTYMYMLRLTSTNKLCLYLAEEKEKEEEKKEEERKRRRKRGGGGGGEEEEEERRRRGGGRRRRRGRGGGGGGRRRRGRRGGGEERRGRRRRMGSL